MPAPPLSLVPEADAGLRAWAVEPDHGVSPEAMGAWLSGRIGGAPRPGWAGGEGGAHLGAITTYAAGPATIWPAMGAVADAEGRVFKASFGEALASGRRLDELAARPPRRRIGPAAVFLPYGASFNFGHFLLDALPSLLALDEAGLLEGRTVVAPRLKPWQTGLLDLAFPELQVAQDDATVEAEAAVWADSMDHYLHRPGPIVGRLRERISARAPAPRTGGRRLYVSRRGWSMRVLLNEAELEQALAQRGFEVVHPERLAAAEQVRLFREAETVVGATGAALAGALFVPGGCRVIELLPQGYAHPWVRDLCLAVGADWRGWFEPAPLPLRDVPWRHRLRRGFRFAWRLDMPAFLQWLDAG